MKLRSITQYGLIIATLIISIPGFARHANTHPEQAVGTNTIRASEKDFNFNWNNYATIASNQEKLKKTEAFLKTITDYSHLSAAERQALGKLLYKLGTFYTHISREPDLAIQKMHLAESLLTTKQDKAWNDNHLAYAYEQKYAASGLIEDKKMGLDYTKTVISELYRNKSNKEVAFAYCVKGLIFNDAKDYVQAETNFRTALHIYEKIPYGKDDQYARAKNRLANIILDQNGRDNEALTMLKQLNEYWTSKGNIDHAPYAARNYISLGQAYFKVGNFQAARDELNNAINIYTQVYGNNSKLLVKPYELLSDAYKKLGQIKQASICKEKAITLKQG